MSIRYRRMKWYMKTEWKVKNFEFHSSLGNSLAYIEPFMHYICL
uniref:Bm671, isoform b n=1 Tax=Brugia malayi TaxID=6279 RepID=A0A1I9G4L5_BRUMA|nr:Bm671, isoform b [Brugia malayi]